MSFRDKISYFSHNDISNFLKSLVKFINFSTIIQSFDCYLIFANTPHNLFVVVKVLERISQNIIVIAATGL